jgi:hypothetical protein
MSEPSSETDVDAVSPDAVSPDAVSRDVAPAGTATSEVRGPRIDVQQTGDPRVDAALSRLADLDDLPLAAQVTVFDDVHRLLQDALTATDALPPAGSPSQ